MIKKSFELSALFAFTVALSFGSGSVLAKEFTEKSFVAAPLGHGVYELSLDPAQHIIYAASAPSFDKEKTSGLVFKLDPTTLSINEKIATARRTFATAMDEQNHTLYLGNALEGSLTLLDTRTGKVTKIIQLSDEADPNKKAHVREVVLDNKHQRLYISGIGEKDKGLLWVVDTRQQQLIDTLDKIEPVGFAVDTAGDKVYVVTGGGELVTLDAKTSAVISSVKVDPAEPNHYFLNIALNTQAGLGYIADTNTNDVLVVKLATGKLVHRIPSPNSIAVLYNAARDEIYVTHRNAHQISIIDAKSNTIKHTIKTAAMPNSLLLSPDAKTLYASIKQDEKAKSADYVLKIDLNTL